MLPEQAIQRRGNGHFFRIVKRKGPEPLGMIPSEADPGKTLDDRQAILESLEDLSSTPRRGSYFQDRPHQKMVK